MFKKFVLTCALLVGASTAQALTIGAVEPVPGVAPIVSSSGSLSSDGLGGFFFSPNGIFNGTQAGSGETFDITVVENTLVPSLSQLAVFSAIGTFGISTPALFTAGAMDIQASNPGNGFKISALYNTTFNFVDPAFDLVLVEIMTGEANNPLTSPFTVAVDAQISLTPVAPIPLPATLPLLVAGLGAVFVFRRRRNA